MPTTRLLTKAVRCSDQMLTAVRFKSNYLSRAEENAIQIVQGQAHGKELKLSQK